MTAWVDARDIFSQFEKGSAKSQAHDIPLCDWDERLYMAHRDHNDPTQSLYIFVFATRRLGLVRDEFKWWIFHTLKHRSNRRFCLRVCGNDDSPQASRSTIKALVAQCARSSGNPEFCRRSKKRIAPSNDPRITPQKAILAGFFSTFWPIESCKVAHNVIVRPTGIYFSECLDFHYITKPMRHHVFRKWRWFVKSDTLQGSTKALETKQSIERSEQWENDIQWHRTTLPWWKRLLHGGAEK